MVQSLLGGENKSENKKRTLERCKTGYLYLYSSRHIPTLSPSMPFTFWCCLSLPLSSAWARTPMHLYINTPCSDPAPHDRARLGCIRAMLFLTYLLHAFPCIKKSEVLVVTLMHCLLGFQRKKTYTSLEYLLACVCSLPQFQAEYAVHISSFAPNGFFRTYSFRLLGHLYAKKILKPLIGVLP